MPDIVSEIITPMTEFGVLASDGLWDIMEPQLVVNFVRKMLNKKNNLQVRVSKSRFGFGFGFGFGFSLI